MIHFIKNGGNNIVKVNVSFLYPSSQFLGRNVLITGGTSGIGLEIAKEFLDEGAEVIITGRNQEKLDVTKQIIKNERLHVLQWDVSDVESIDTKLLEMNNIIHNVDTFVNNAGIYGYDDWNTITPALYDKVMEVNQRGLFFMCQAEGKYLIENKINGKIINIVSIAGVKSGFDPYSVSKWGAMDITKGLAKELVSKGIIVNGIAPGDVVTNIHDGYKGKDVNENAYAPEHKTKRYTLVEEVASMTKYLASNAANNIVGQVFIIDGGWTLF